MPGLSLLNWTWFFLPSVSYICVIMELFLVTFLANIAGSGRSPMNLRIITQTTREACSDRKQSQTVSRELKASCHFFLFRLDHFLLLPRQAVKIPSLPLFTPKVYFRVIPHVSNILDTLRKWVQF